MQQFSYIKRNLCDGQANKSRMIECDQANNLNTNAPTIAPRIGATTGIQASPQREEPLDGIGQDGVQQSRHEITGRVQARTGRTTHGGHETPHNETNHDGSGSVIRFAPRHGQAAQGAEHEHEGAEELVDEVVDAVVVGVGGAEGAEDGVGVFGVLIVRVVGDVHHELTCGGTKQLGDDVRQHQIPVEQPFTAWAMVMAGLMCAPETPPNMSTGNITPKP